MAIISAAVSDVVAALEGGVTIGEVIAVFAATCQRLQAAADGGIASTIFGAVAGVLYGLAGLWGYNPSPARNADGTFRRKAVKQ